ncbi:MAG: MFS transporter [Planctomycetes bacterium]|nr:MFS transporter [Planctomycetota bacterium]
MTSNQTNQLYTLRFFQVCVAVVLFMTGLALQFHFGQYVEFLGHGVDTLGRILSISMIGTLAIRLHIGRWIDRFGCRPTWICGALIVALCVGSLQFVERLWLLTLLRAVSTMASAAVMTTVAVFAALTAPPHRRAESIGTIGMAGFVGMIAGPTLGDWIFAGGGESIAPYRVFFSASALCSLLACGVVGLIAMPMTSESATTASGNAVKPVAGRPSQVRIILEHWPGMILLIGVVFSMAFCLQSMFLERLAEARGFRDIKLFFLAYGPTAMLLRVVFRRLPERLGRSRTLVLGMLLMAIGQLTLRNVQVPYQLVLPGILMGAGHSFIFPSMVDLAAERLPLAFRGTGTSMILGAGDVGMLIGFAGLGGIIDAYGFDTALTVLASTVLGTAAIFALSRPKKIFLRTR